MVIHVKGEFTALQARPVRRPVGVSVLDRFEYCRGVLTWHHHDAVVVGHDHITWPDIRPGADDRDLDVPWRLIHRAPGGDRLRPHREAHFGQRRDVPYPGVDDNPSDAVRLKALGEPVAHVPVVAWACGGNHEDVARLCLLHGDMNRPIVAWGDLTGQRIASHARRTEDRADVRSEQPGAALSFAD